MSMEELKEKNRIYISEAEWRELRDLVVESMLEISDVEEVVEKEE